MAGLGDAQGAGGFITCDQDPGVAEVGDGVAGPERAPEEGEASAGLAFLEQIVDGGLAVESDGGISGLEDLRDEACQGAVGVVLWVRSDRVGRERDDEGRGGGASRHAMITT